MTNLCATHGMNIPDVGCPKCLKAENERLKETLACPRLTIDAPAEQFKAVLADWEKGLVVNSQDLLNALMWRLRNQAKEIARLHKSVDTLNAANRFLSEQLEAERSTHEPSSAQNSRPAAAALATGSIDQAAPAPILQQSMEPDNSPLTHQEIFSAVYHHASEITRLTAAVPTECSPQSRSP